MARPRKQTYTLKMYLDKIQDGDICNDADVQRNFVWNKEQINELIATVLTDDYIPPIILGEEDNAQLHIADGGQRSIALKKYRHGNYKITSSIEYSVISYKKKILNEYGNTVYEDATFDIKNKTYRQLPDELKKKFNEYQIETVIHENCDLHRISQYIKRYNNHTPMNTNQKAFTYIDNFAGQIREMLNSKFFLDYSNFTEAEKTKGVVERVLVETVMCTNHLKHWKKQTKAICTYLNNCATKEEFENLANNIHRLENIVADDVKDIFDSKDSFIFLTLFDKFTKLGLEDIKFAEFLKEFKYNLRATRLNGEEILFDEIDKAKGTKDKSVIVSKLDMLETLMLEFLNIEKVEDEGFSIDEEIFISQNVGIDIEALHEDMDFYKESLEYLKNKTIRDGSKLLNEENQLSLLAMVVYSYKEDKDLDEWMEVYARNNNTYFVDQKRNYLHMKSDFNKFLNSK
ncbi:MAG: DUF262 domain-containing protein [Lachnospiraceae bacterium]|nr:DUF262 domain-containing protein [Lachnospiraceae bacterium]